MPKVVGGITPDCTALASALYGAAIETIVPVSSTRVAEMVKLLENTFRAVNIGLVNELAMMCDRMNIDVWEVVEAAKTKPFGFMAFYPGPGLGGHCIPVDPFYLSWKARQSGFEPRFIELAGHINGAMPHAVVDKVAEALNARRKALNGSSILIAGVAYKRDIDDLRESPALDVMGLLHAKGARLSYIDPYIPSIEAQELAGEIRHHQRARGHAGVRAIRLRGDRHRPPVVRLPGDGGQRGPDRRYPERDQDRRAERLPPRRAPSGVGYGPGGVGRARPRNRVISDHIGSRLAISWWSSSSRWSSTFARAAAHRRTVPGSTAVSCNPWKICTGWGTSA